MADQSSLFGEFGVSWTTVCSWLGSLPLAWQPSAKFAVGPAMLYLVLLLRMDPQARSEQAGVGYNERMCEWLAAVVSMLGEPQQGGQHSISGTVSKPECPCLKKESPALNRWCLGKSVFRSSTCLGRGKKISTAA